jgi:DNA-binding response OmpR family regulator
VTERPSPTPIPEVRLLVVDDEPNVRAALKRSLDLMGYRTDEAESGFRALRMLEYTPYDLMVLDLRMPGMDGVEVMRRAREIRPDLLVIVLTGHATLESAIAAVRSHAANFLLKPASLHEIGGAVAEALQQRIKTLRRQHLLEVMDQTLEALRESEVSPRQTPTLERFLVVGPLTLDSDKRLAVIGEAPSRTVELTESEARILAYMMERGDQVISTRELARGALGYELTEQEAQSIVRPHIFRLRQKIEADSQEPELICTVRGRGYRLAV